MLQSGYSVLQFHFDQKTFLESKERPFETRLHESLDRPDVALLLSFLRDDLAFCSQENLLDFRSSSHSSETQTAAGCHRLPAAGDGGSEKRDEAPARKNATFPLCS